MSTRRQYLVNILWGWGSSLGLILNGILLTPYLLRRLGAEQYGIWTLGLSLVEYFWMIDLGVRPATVKLTAEYRAKEEWDTLNSMLSTATLYSAGMGLTILALISLNAGWIARAYHISNPAFPLLIHAVSVSWAFGLVFNVFEATLEGFQRFDLTSRIFICFMLVRSLTLLALVSLGYGLAAMSAGLLATQLLMYAAFLISLRKVYPGMRLSPGLVTKNAGREIWMYARQVVSGMLSARLLTSAIPSLITLFLGVRSLAYYSITQKVVDYTAEGIGRIGLITAPRATDWMARGLRAQVIRLAEYGNRYCLTLWLLVGTFLTVYGGPLFRLWYSPELGDRAAVLLPVMVFGQVFTIGQFVSGSVLMGTGQFGSYSASLMVEALAIVVGFFLVLPHFGLVGGAAVYSGMLVLNRCVNLSRIFAGKFEIAQAPFLWRVFRIPLFLAGADVAALFAVRHFWLAGSSWEQLILIGGCNSVAFALAAFFLVVEPDHRALAEERIAATFSRLTGRRPLMTGIEEKMTGIEEKSRG